MSNFQTRDLVKVNRVQPRGFDPFGTLGQHFIVTNVDDSTNTVAVEGDPRFWFTGRFERIARPDADGWYSWSGGENPVPGREVAYKLKNGSHFGSSTLSNELYWDWTNAASDIVAFRLVENASPAAEPQAPKKPVILRPDDIQLGDRVRVMFEVTIGEANSAEQGTLEKSSLAHLREKRDAIFELLARPEKTLVVGDQVIEHGMEVGEEYHGEIRFLGDNWAMVKLPNGRFKAIPIADLTRVVTEDNYPAL